MAGNQETFDLIFTGELVPGHDRAEVRANLAALFRIPPEQVDKLFSNAPVALKKNVDSEAANRYRVAVKKAGARLATQVHQGAAKAAPVAPDSRPQPPPVSPAKQAPTPPAPAPSAADPETFSTALGAQPARSDAARPVIDAPDYGLAPVGARLTSAASPPPPAATAPDWEVAAAEGFLLRDEERAAEPPPAPVPVLDVAPAGAPVLEGHEPLPLPELELDLSHISLAAPGADLSSGRRPEPPPPPRTDHLRLE